MIRLVLSGLERQYSFKVKALGLELAEHVLGLTYI